MNAKIKDCRFDVPSLSAFTCRGKGNRVELHRTSLRALYGVDVISYADPENETLLTLHDSSFSGPAFLRGPVNPGSGPVRVTGRNNEFRPADALAWFQGAHPGRLPHALEWETENDRFPEGRAHILVSPAGSEGGRIPISLLPQMERGTATIIRTGETYPSLQEAIDAAESGDTLELSGWFFTGNPEIRIQEKDNLHLRSAPESVATIVSLVDSQHALFSFCPVRISGLRFYRFHAPSNSLPLLGILAQLGTSTVEDCVFESYLQTDPGQPSGVALSLTNVSDARVQRCLFRAGTAMYVVEQGEPEREAAVQIRDCLSLSWSFLMARWREGEDRMNLSISRSIVKGNFFLTNFPSREFHALDLRVHDSIVDVETALVAMKSKRSTEPLYRIGA